MCLLTYLLTLTPTRSPLAVPQSYFFSWHVFFGCFIMCVLFSPSDECISTKIAPPLVIEFHISGRLTGNRFLYQWALQCINKNMWILPIRLSTNDPSDYWNVTDSSDQWRIQECGRGAWDVSLTAAPWPRGSASVRVRWSWNLTYKFATGTEIAQCLL